jgi:Family of unknown function (DUF6498)
MMIVLHLILALALNAVPIYGTQRWGWSAGTVLVLFWLENLLGALVNCVRIGLHWYLTRKRGHWLGEAQVNGKSTRMSYLAQFAVIALVFTAAHGVFVGAFAFLFGDKHPGDPAWQFSSAQFWLGAKFTAGILVFDLLIDLPTLRSRSFAWLERLSGLKLGRVFVLHIALIFGFMAMAASDSPMAILLVLFGIKALFDLATTGGGNKEKATPAVPEKAPEWALKLLLKAGKQNRAEMEKEWLQRQKQQAAAEANKEKIGRS